MKFRKDLMQKKTVIKTLLGVFAFALVVTAYSFDSFAATGKVTAATAKIRSEASTDSSVVGSTSKGASFDVVSGVKDAQGTTWYKVPNGNNTYGYIRGDLIQVSGDVSVESKKPASSSSDKPADTVPTAVGEQAATITQDSVRVRSGASTSHDTLTSLKNGASVTIIGEAKDSSGKTWYQIRFGNSQEGYVRSDMLAVGGSAETTTENTEGTEPVEGEEGTQGVEGEEGNVEETPEEVVEPEVPAEPEHNDYEVVYNDDTYWLYDNMNGTMMSVTNLLEVVEQVNKDNQSLQEQIKTGKIIIIVLAAILVLLVVAVTVLIFKLRDAYYYEEEYDEEEEEEIEPEPIAPKKRKRVREEEFVEEPAPVRKKEKRQAPVSEEIERPRKKKERPEAELEAAEEKKPVKKPAPRKAQNFLIDDDEFEFEFLNMDDKD